MAGKNITKSKTIWLAVVTAALGGLNAAGEYVTDPQTLSLIAVAIGVLSAFLRSVTKEPLK